MKLDTKQLKNISILYVEDDPVVRLQTEKVMKKLFRKVFVAEDGTLGLALYKENSQAIDIIVTDINMPNMSGLEMIRKIKKINNSIATIVTTAYFDVNNLSKAIEVNVDKYITKPIQVKELTVSIVKLVLKYRRINNMEELAKSLVQKTTQSDIEKNQLQNELVIIKRQNHYFKTILDHLTVQFKTDKNGTIESFSTKFKTFLGYDDSIVGKNVTVLQSNRCTQESFQKMMLKAIHTKKTVVSTYTFITSTDRFFEAEVTMTPSYGEDSIVSGYTFYLDIL